MFYSSVNDLYASSGGFDSASVFSANIRNNSRMQQQRDFQRENAIRIKKMSARAKFSRANSEKSEATKPNRPLKAFRDVKAKVSHYMTNGTVTDSSSQQQPKTIYLKSHAKTGPFLEAGANVESYKNMSKSVPRLDLPDDDYEYEEEEEAVAIKPFNEISIPERRDRIREMIREIKSVPPLIEKQSVTKGHFFGLGINKSRPTTSLSSAISTETLSAVERSLHERGIPPTRMSEYSSRPPSSSVLKKARSVTSIRDTEIKDGPPPRLLRRTASRSSLISGESSKRPPLVRSNSVGQRIRHQSTMTTATTATNTSPPMSRAESRASTMKEAVQTSNISEADDAIAVEHVDGGGDRRLPVVKGVGVDYVHANIDGASVMGHQKRRRRGRGQVRNHKLFVQFMITSSGSVYL